GCAGRQRRKRGRVRNGAKSGIVQCAVAAALSDLGVTDGTVALNVESDYDQGQVCAGESSGLPLVSDALHDETRIRAELVSKRAVGADTHATRAGLFEHR